MIIRPEKPEDFKAIYSLIKTAFETAKVADGDEQDYTDRLRISGNYIPELALVATEDEVLIGHIMFTDMPIKTDGKNIKALLVAPLSVALEYRNKGIGAALMREGLKRAKDMGYKAAILCGDPDYYNRFGFKEAKKSGISYNLDIPEKYILLYELDSNAMQNVSGYVSIFI